MIFSVKLSEDVAFERWECLALVDRPREVKEHFPAAVAMQLEMGVGHLPQLPVFSVTG